MTRTSIFPAGSVPAFDLAQLGWNPDRDQHFHDRCRPSAEPGRIVAASRGLALVRTATCETWAGPSGNLRTRLDLEGLTLCAGDWVALRCDPSAQRATVLDLLPRGPSLLRREPGAGGRSQCLAANLDVVLLVMGLDLNFRPARLERLLALAWGSGARPVVVLTKADLAGAAEAGAARIAAVAPGVPVRVVSARTGAGMDDLRACLGGGATGVLAGSSGAGKTTLLNALMGEAVGRTGEVRAADGRGRHTTTLRELFLLPGGGCLIDTPGVREVGLCAESDLDGAFSDLETLAAACRFRDCSHGAEPGCAVQAALAEGRLDPDRYASYRRLRREADFEAARNDQRLWREREDRWRRIGKLQKQLKKGPK